MEILDQLILLLVLLSEELEHVRFFELVIDLNIFTVVVLPLLGHHVFLQLVHADLGAPLRFFDGKVHRCYRRFHCRVQVVTGGKACIVRADS